MADPTNPTEQSGGLLDSGIAQIILPLIAGGLTAFRPRIYGPASQAAMGVLGGLDQMRMSGINQKIKQNTLDDQKKKQIAVEKALGLLSGGDQSASLHGAAPTADPTGPGDQPHEAVQKIEETTSGQKPMGPVHDSQSLSSLTVPPAPQGGAQFSSLTRAAMGVMANTNPEKFAEHLSTLGDRPAVAPPAPGIGEEQVYTDRAGVKTTRKGAVPEKPVPVANPFEAIFSPGASMQQKQDAWKILKIQHPDNITTRDDVKQIAGAILNGQQPPDVKGLYRNAAPVKAELARNGFDLTKANLEWQASQHYMATMNGTQQTRMRQAVSVASDSLDKIDQLFQQWQQVGPASGFKIINKSSLAAAKQLPGEAGAVANALDAQIADFSGELGNIIMGGNSPTDHALELAGRNLSSDWNEATMKKLIPQLKENIGYRRNAIMNSGPAGVASDSVYQPRTGGAGAATPAPAAAPAPAASSGAVTMKDGTSWKKVNGEWKQLK
jgi:hypothetical protein